MKMYVYFSLLLTFLGLLGKANVGQAQQLSAGEGGGAAEVSLKPRRVRAWQGGLDCRRP